MPISSPTPRTTPPPSIHVTGVHLSLGRTIIFENLTFQAEAGRFTGILGPSGVGKTTLLRLIAGLIPTHGATIGDSTGASLKGRLAWMAQKDLLLPWLSALDNVRLGARLRGKSANTEEHARALLHAVGLENRANDRPDT
ncbi:MAG: ATP-binding cassette domain-containing protein, partial [Rhodospirillaceae bacterium]|nr:ATP-binding cassette domain-containing protein [Rhodospirillaceae bacterium]